MYDNDEREFGVNRELIHGYKYVLYCFYIAYIVSSVAFMLDPSPSLNAAMATVAYWTWTGLLLIGGLGGLWSAVTNKHYIERVALVALGGGLGVYILGLLISDNTREESGISYGLTVLILASIGALGLRYLVLNHQIQVRERVSGVIRHDQPE